MLCCMHIVHSYVRSPTLSARSNTALGGRGAEHPGVISAAAIGVPMALRRDEPPAAAYLVVCRVRAHTAYL